VQRESTGFAVFSDSAAYAPANLLAMSLGTGADSPKQITHAFVLKGFDLAWSMLEGEKIYPDGDYDKEPIGIKSKDIENRHTRLAPGWYGVILGKGTKGVTRERYEECKAKLPHMHFPEWDSDFAKRRKGHLVGVVKIGHSLPYDYCKESPWAIGPICNIITHAGWIDTPVPCKGNLGACPITDKEERERFQCYADYSFRDGNIFRTFAEERHPYQGPSIWPHAKRKPCHGCIDMRDKDERGKLREFLLKAQENLKKKLKTENSAE